jgi:hypothetical protein
MGDDEDAYKYFVKILLPESTSNDGETKEDDSATIADEHAARSFRAMTILKQDLSRSTFAPSVLIKNPDQAGLLAKDLLLGLSSVSASKNRYSTIHIRELLDALLEAFPEKVMGAAAAGGKQGVQDHLGPLLLSDQTLSILTHLVCYGATGRKGIASAEKSAQHTAMYQHLHNDPKSKITLGQRRKFVKAMADFQLMDQLAQRLAQSLTSDSNMGTNNNTNAGEEICETILTILEVVGYPPEDPPQYGQQQQQQQGEKKSKEDVMVGEDVLLAPLASPDWWKSLLETIQRPNCTFEQREAIARTCNQSFALATGDSSRICKSLAPATDATEKTPEDIVEEKEETVTNRLVEWGLTDKMHAALISQLPLLIQVLNLPNEGILDHQATTSIDSSSSEEEPVQEEGEPLSELIRHPGRYRTVPLGSWRIQLLSLLREILTYRGKAKGSRDSTDGSPPLCVLAMDAIMELPVPPELQKAKKGEEKQDPESATQTIYNPWPALCSFVWAYPNNDFYHINFFQMLQSVVLEHHEVTLRLVLQKSKFLSRAVNSLTSTGPLQGVLMNCLNLLHLRSQALPHSAFLAQYMGSHDGWKANVDCLAE